jgi:hypothetical protein
MCNCVDDIRQQVMQQYPEANNIIMPINYVTGGLYLAAEKVIIKNGKTKRSPVTIFLEKCPFCGEMYRKNNA